MSLISSQSSGDFISDAKTPLLSLLALVIVFIGTVSYVGISGDFPLIDDWSYAISTRMLVATGTWKPFGWTSMPLISNALWAAPICALSSCGFDDLRLTTLLASSLLFVMTFFLVKANNKTMLVPLFAALLLAFNPIAYALSFTFMTDILFSALVTTSAFLFVLSLERDSIPLIVFGTIIAILATFSRQLGLCLPLAFLVVRLLQTDRWPRKLILALTPFLVCTASLMLFNRWLRETGRTPDVYDFQLNLLASTIKAPVLEVMSLIGLHVIETLLYLGLFSLPLLLLTRRHDIVAVDARSWWRHAPIMIAGCVTLLGVATMWARHQIMPLFGDILVPQGIGPLLLRDTFELHLPNVPSLPSFFWIVVTLLSLWGVFELSRRTVTYMINIIQKVRYGEHNPNASGPLFAMIAILAYLAPLMLSGLFDRYLIPVLPLTFFFLTSISVAGPVDRHHILIATLMCLLTIAFTVLTNHDHMAWNRARWAAITDAQSEGIAGPDNLDGGFEYNGFFSYSPSYKESHEKSHWWVGRDDYQIAFGPIDGMKVVKSYSYETALPSTKRSILLLAR
ncbi:conserved hypothetical protein [Beijerinckia indica subsp. indica ATCC 9039]|uniref:Glycosyltransferase RgtA/B/C/D-like domain-containing protein n=2 Tax=Beijerinckia TaxID=532 RepID=B2IKE6_BEII9|nr:conserved hypothetical protein [Beijerinckia indica subsp. indica ATCC 9039]